MTTIQGQNDTERLMKVWKVDYTKAKKATDKNYMYLRRNPNKYLCRYISINDRMIRYNHMNDYGYHVRSKEWRPILQR